MARSRRVGAFVAALLGGAASLAVLGGPATAAPDGHHNAHSVPAKPAKPESRVPADAVDPTVGPRIVGKPNESGTVSPSIVWTVGLTASSSSLYPNQYSTLTAAANASVTATSLWISIYDSTAGLYVAICGSGSTCSASVTESTPTTHTYVAQISSKPLPPTYPPPSVRATSGTVSVSWQSVSVSLAASPTTTGVGTSTTLTATTSADVGATQYYTEIFNATTGTEVAVCGSGTTCSATVTGSTATTDSFVSYVGNYTTSYPPTGVEATSATSWVTWSNAGFAVSLAMAPGTATATATTPVTPGTFFVEIFDETAGGLPVATCNSVPACTATTVAGHNYVAIVSTPTADTSLPPADAVASSNIGVGS